MNSDQHNTPRGTAGGVLDPTMSLVGRLEDLSLGEILQIVSLSKRSGLLRLEAPGGKANLYIKAGKVIYASSTDEKEGVLSLLTEGGLVQKDQLEGLREDLESASSTLEFRALLEEKTGISKAGFQEVLKNRVEMLVYSLFLWEEGTFSFQLIVDESTHPVLSRVAPFFLDEGVGAQFLVMEGARRKDEMMRGAPPSGGREGAPESGSEVSVEDGWEEEFEQQLTGSGGVTEEAPEAEDLEEELEEFVVPQALPALAESLPGAVVMVGLTPAHVAGITEGLKDREIGIDVFDNGADALTRIQELRQKGTNPFLLVNLEATGITDGRALGGLETIATMWDFGFHLPVGLLCEREIPVPLASKLEKITGLTVFRYTGPSDLTSLPALLQTLGSALAPAVSAPPEVAEPLPVLEEEAPPAPGPEEDEARPEPVPPKVPREDYYDIEGEFSKELGDFDLGFEGIGDVQGPEQEVPLDPHMGRLSSYVHELNRQDISGEITLLALRFASVFASRAILFLVRKEDMRGLGQFGVDLGHGRDADSVIRSLRLPLEEDSIFRRVAQNKQSYKGPLPGSGTENALLEALGGGKPKQIYIGPIISMGKVAVLLYGDDFPTCKGLEPTHTLDIFLSHVGLALDRAFLEMKLKSQRS